MSSELKIEVIGAIHVLGLNDCDIKSITVVCNPNYIRGADYEVSEQIKAILTELTEEHIIKAYDKIRYIFRKNNIGNTKKVKLKLYSFIKNT